MGVELAVVAAVVTLAAAAQMVSGFGFALLAVPLMGLAVDVKTAVVVCTICGTASNTYQAIVDRAERDGALAGRLIVASILGMPLGWLVLEHSSSGQLKVVVGVLVLVAVFLVARKPMRADVNRSIEWCAGVLSGALAIATSTNGPPLVVLLKAKHLSPQVFRSTINSVFCVVALVSIAVFALSGRVNGEVTKASIIAIPGLVAGIWVGRIVRGRLSDAVFWRLVLTMLVATALASIATGVM
jgi:uncharacterized protein